MKVKDKIVIKAFLFIGIFAIIFAGLNYFLQPVWYEWSNYDSHHGFYETPNNTIESVFLGASIVISGISPMEMYENYGICSYNLATEQQPMLASYYWLEEAYRLHDETLRNVILDVSMLRGTPSKEYYQKALDGMKMSRVKFNAIREYVGSFGEILTYIFPIFEYHNRWTALEKSDFEKNHFQNYLRGYNFTTDRYFETNTYDKLAVPIYYCNEDAAQQQLEETSLYYLWKMIRFCKTHGLKLVFTKTPVLVPGVMPEWNFFSHKAVEQIAEKYEIESYDFNYLPYIDQINYNSALDSIDGIHMNYYGAKKLTAWFGQYLFEQCEATDVRNDSRYSFMKDELEGYHKNIIEVVNLRKIADPVEYLKTACKIKNAAVFVSIMDDGTEALSQDQRQGFASIGLDKLEDIGFGESYIAVIKDGIVENEQREEWDQAAYDEAQILKDVGMVNDIENVDLRGTENSIKENIQPLTASGVLDGTKYRIVSGGAFLGNTSSILINDTEYSPAGRGLNIVVYNYADNVVLDAANFDTYASSTRVANLEEELPAAIEEGVPYTELPEKLKKLYLYNRRCDNARISGGLDLASERGLYNLMETFRNREDYVICISALDDAAGSLYEDARKYFSDIGLQELSLLEVRDSYIGILDGDSIIFDQKDHGEAPISTKGLDYSIVSGGIESGNISSIRINETEYSLMGRGLNIVVYDRQLDEVVIQAEFDTCAVPIVVS